MKPTLGQRFGALVHRLLGDEAPKLPTGPIPPHWYDIVQRMVPLSRRLGAADRERLLRIAQLFLQEKPMEGCAGLELTDEIRVTIAVTASLLLLHLPYPRFPRLRRVLVYPDTFMPVRVQSHRSLTAPDEPGPTLGEAWNGGVVVLAWTSVANGAANPGDGRNVVLHEFAHVLDFEDGAADGRPILGSASARQVWGAVIAREFAHHQEAVETTDDIALDPYGATNQAEFFAVATEAFFESGPRLKERLPDLYDVLRRFYHGSDQASAGGA